MAKYHGYSTKDRNALANAWNCAIYIITGNKSNNKNGLCKQSVNISFVTSKNISLLAHGINEHGMKY